MAEMSWKECIDKKIIFKISPDLERAKQMEKMADLRFEFWNVQVKEKFSSLKIEACYEIIKDLIFAHLYKKGLNCTNHLCLISFLKEEFKDFEFEIEKIDELRKVRNDFDYRGLVATKEYLEKNEIEFKHIIKELKKRLWIV